MDTESDPINAAESLMLRYRVRAEDAMRFYTNMQSLVLSLETQHKLGSPIGLPLRQLNDALSMAASAAYEEVLLWRTARAEFLRAIEKYPAKPAANAVEK